MENITLTVPNSVIPSTVFLLSIHTVENSVLLLMLSKQQAYFSFSKSHCLLSLPNSCHLQPLKHTTNVDFLILNCMQKKKKKSPTSDEIVANIQEFQLSIPYCPSALDQDYQTLLIPRSIVKLRIFQGFYKSQNSFKDSILLDPQKWFSEMLKAETTVHILMINNPNPGYFSG